MGKKYYHMFFSISLATMPTALLTFILIKTVEMSIYIPIILLMYYFYFFSSIFLFIAGATDPGILERNLVK